MGEVYIILSVVRIITALLIFKWPLLGVFASIYIDISDFQFFHVQNAAQMESYQIWDKIFDTFYLSVAASVSFRWKDNLAKKISIFSFLYRLVGVIIFPLFEIRSLLIFFPNFFENFFIFYMLFAKLAKTEKLLTSRLDTALIILSILIPSVIREYFMHVIKTPPWDAYDIPDYLGFPRMVGGLDLSYVAWIFILLSLPVIVLTFQVTRKRKSQN